MFRPPHVFMAVAAVAAVAAAPVLAQTAAEKARIDAAKAAGVVGEQADGFVGFRLESNDAPLREAVRSTNAARAQVYARSAEAAGTTAAVAGARMFELNLLPRIATGEWYRNAQGQWVQTVTPERPALAERVMRFALLLLLSLMVAGFSTWLLGATWEAIGGGEMSVHGWIALALGILGTFGLAWGLMALAFRSHREGWDDRVNNSLDPGRPPDHER